MIIGKQVEVRYNKETYGGTLVHFGISFEDLRYGVGHYTEAIIEKEDGQLKTAPVCCVRVLKS